MLNLLKFVINYSFEINWNEIESNLNSIKASQLFLSTFTPFETFFPIKKKCEPDICGVLGLLMDYGSPLII